MSEEINLNWGAENSGTVEPPAVAATPAPVQTAPAVQKEDPLSLQSLDEKQKTAVLNLKDKIDVSDAGAVVAYGAEAQNKVAAFSDSILKNIKTKDAGEAGQLLTNLVVEIKDFDATAEEKGGLFGFFGGIKRQIDKINAQYGKVEGNIEKIVDALEGHKRVLLKDVAMLDELYANNYSYYKELTLYIIAGKEKVAELNTVTIPALRQKAETSGDEIDAQKLNDAVNNTNRFEKKLHDLSLSRMIAIQMAPQIRLLQNNDTQLVDKIQSSIVNSIPLWKNQIVIALGLANAKSALESQKKVTDMTNELLQKNSALLKQGTLDIAEESEKSIISIETIQKTNQDLIETINGVIDIQKKGREDRQAAEVELARLETEFKQALLSSRTR
jgi:uncharacterized protein YaaN involved in tellurite resistance